MPGLEYRQTVVGAMTALAMMGAGNLARADASPRGYRLGLEVVTCWLGGIWADAEGVSPDRRAAVSREHCREGVAAVYGNEDQRRYEQLRALEPGAVADLVDEVRASESSPMAAPAVALMQATAAAAREAMYARRAADRVKIDIDVESPPQKLTRDESAAAGFLAEHRAIDALANLGGPLAVDAHAIAVLLAMDRIGAATALPKQLKFIDTRDLFALLFGVRRPLPSFDATREPRAGLWVEYLTQVATATGHPPATSASGEPRARRALAWAGILEGVADLLRKDERTLSAGAVPALSRPVREAAMRLESEAATARQVVAPALRG
jgi:hypothetical protein